MIPFKLHNKFTMNKKKKITIQHQTSKAKKGKIGKGHRIKKCVYYS